MGCVHSRVENEESVRRCKERRRLMKQLLSRRAELAAAHMAYLQSLRNTGATLRQFTDVESMIPGNPPPDLTLPPSPPPPPPPPPPLPPSPPPLPHFSPVRKKEKTDEELIEEDSIDVDDSDSCATPPPPLPGSSWEFWDPFGPPTSTNSSSPVTLKKDEEIVLQAGAVEEEDWAETNTEFWEEDDDVGERKVEAGTGSENVVLNQVKGKGIIKELVDDNSSAVSWLTKDSDMAMVVWRSKKTLIGIVKELDDYFLKAAAAGKDVVVLLDSNRGHCNPWEFDGRKGKSSKSAKVFNTLSWNWSARSPQSNRDPSFQNPTDTGRSGNHCTTLEKLYIEEQKLYKEVKAEEIAKLHHKRNTLLLQKLEVGNPDMLRIEKARDNIEELQIRLASLQGSINMTCLSISKLRDEELYPQLIELSATLVHMWRTMYECHQVQTHVSQQVNLLDNRPGTEPTSDSHRHATAQLEAEVASWHSSFCNLINSQREYIRVLNQWVRLTDCLLDSTGLRATSGIHSLCDELQRALDRLPEKVAAEAIKSFLSVIHSIVLQHTVERSLKKKADRLESRLEKELDSLHRLEKSNKETIINTDQFLNLSSKNMKLEAFKKKVEEEKSKYLNSVRMSRAMTLNNLQTSLPNVFQALTGFAGVFMQAFEGISGCNESATSHSEAVSPLCS
ncbi:protein ALTERED PHOSPHATE STARVATION RESPONSE 1 [Typha angustifolia]|uniref:protein ALTERED PHOSPHATE STARVATION RESPONSE 1 n=1 Tax=Typha angustifolia TaxID=59011 RepID=UPI003C2FFB74